MQLLDRKHYLLDGPKKSSIRQIERIDQIDSFHPGPRISWNNLSVANEMQMSENSTCRIAQKIRYSPKRTNRSNKTSIFLR